MQGSFRRIEIPFLTEPVFVNSRHQLLHRGLLQLNPPQRLLVERILLGGCDLDGLANEMAASLGSPREISEDARERVRQMLTRFIDGVAFADRARLDLPRRADIVIVDAGIGGVYVHALDLWAKLHRDYGLKALLLAPVEPPYGYDEQLSDWLFTPRKWKSHDNEFSRHTSFVNLGRSIVAKVPSRLLLFTHRFPTTFFFDLIEKRPSIIHADGYFDEVLILGRHLEEDRERRPLEEILQDLLYGDPMRTNIMTNITHVMAVWRAFKHARENWLWCESQRRKLAEAFPEMDENLRVVLPLIDTDRFRPRPSRLPARHILYTSTCDPKTIRDKGLLELIEAMKLLPREVGLRMVVHNPKVLPEALHELGSRVEVLSKVSKERMPEIYNSSLVNCRVSRRESSPVSVLESMACGRPVVVSPLIARNIPGIEDGVTGYVVDPGDPQTLASRLLELTSNERRRRKMGREARQRVLRHSFHNNIQAILGHLQRPDQGRREAAGSRLRMPQTVSEP